MKTAKRMWRFLPIRVLLGVVAVVFVVVEVYFHNADVTAITAVAGAILVAAACMISEPEK